MTRIRTFRPPWAPKPSRSNVARAQALYDSAAWRKCRAAFLANNPLCRTCEAEGRTVAATVADHIVEAADDHALSLDWSNLQPLCASCHGRKTRRTHGPTQGQGGGG